MTRLRPWTAVVTILLCGGLLAAEPAFADTATFTNNHPTTLQAGTAGANPCPATIDVSGMQGNLSGATVTLNALDESSVTRGIGWRRRARGALDFLLVSPTGKTVMLLSDVATDGSVIDLTFDDAASGPVPGSVSTSGSFQPTDDDSTGTQTDDFSAGVPIQPFGATMSALYGDDPNGAWQLYVATNGIGGTPSQLGSIGSWALNLTTTTPTAPSSEGTPPPLPTQIVLGEKVSGGNPLAPPDPTKPQVQTAEFSTPPVVGQPTFLQVEASDSDSLVTGLIVNFGEALGLWGETACVEGAPNTGGTVQFDVPYQFFSPGEHTISITILSGGCGTAQTSTVFTKTVTVAAAGARKARASRRAHASLTIPGPQVVSRCKDARLDPTAANVKRIAKALLCVMNEQRKLAKLKPLKNSPRLGKAAITHTRAMIAGGFFAHQGPKEPALKARLRKVKFRASAGENIGAGGGALGSPVGMVNGWMHSQLHRANLLSKSWKYVGIGFIAKFPIKGGGAPVGTYTTDFGPKK